MRVPDTCLVVQAGEIPLYSALPYSMGLLAPAFESVIPQCQGVEPFSTRTPPRIKDRREQARAWAVQSASQHSTLRLGCQSETLSSNVTFPSFLCNDQEEEVGIAR